MRGAVCKGKCNMIMGTTINNLYLSRFSQKLVFEGRELNQLEINRNLKGSLLGKGWTEPQLSRLTQRPGSKLIRFSLLKRQLKCSSQIINWETIMLTQ